MVRRALLGASLLLIFSTALSAQVARKFNHVVIVAGENTNASTAESDMPWLDSLGKHYARASRFYASTHPSIGNYFAMTDGIVETNNDWLCPQDFVVTHDNVVRALIAAGKTWKQYAESMPSVGYIGCDSGSFVTRHAPLPYYKDAQTASQRKNIVPFTRFAVDLAHGTLPNYSFITPNDCNDAHSCSLQTFDNWLRKNISPLFYNAQFMKDGLLIVTFDEAARDNANGGGRVLFVMAGPTVKEGYVSTTFYQDPAICRLSLEGLGITHMPAACARAPQMGEFFTKGSPSSRALSLPNPGAASQRMHSSSGWSAGAIYAYKSVQEWSASNPEENCYSSSGACYEPVRMRAGGGFAPAPAVGAVLAAPADPPVKLRPETMAAFEHYISFTDGRNSNQMDGSGPFLWVDALPSGRREEDYAALKRGEVVIERVKPVENGKSAKCPGGMIHDWVGVIFVPGATLAQTLAQAQDYARGPQMYAPSEVSAKVLKHDGNHYKVAIRYLNKSVVTVTLDVVFNIEYHSIDASRAWSHSQTISVHQVENPGQPDEQVLPEGEGGGYLWSMVTYSRYVEKDGGTYIQTESIALSRSIPAILSWLIGPYTRSIPRKVLTGVLEKTREAILHPPSS